MMPTDPLGQVIEGAQIDCDSPDCFTCQSGRLPHEARADWLSRLRALVATLDHAPILSGGQPSIRVICDQCGEPRWRGQWCGACRAAATRARRLV